MILNITIALVGACCVPILITANNKSRTHFAIGACAALATTHGISLNNLFLFLVGFIFAPLIVILVLALIGMWIAKGESDVNGDPEKDAGILPTRTQSPNAPASTPSPSAEGEGIGGEGSDRSFPDSPAGKLEAPRPWPGPTSTSIPPI